jgi:acetolactate synthase-1/2/3 large subunit
MTNYQWIIQQLKQLGIRHYYGMNGGGILHFTQWMPPFSFKTDEPSYYTIYEYAAGFAPIGHYLANQTIAATLVTTGAASKLALNGASDAHFLGIPALYILALSPLKQIDQYPVQDTSSKGMAIKEQCLAEFPNNTVIIDDIKTLNDSLERIRELLDHSQPAILLIYPDILNQRIPQHLTEKTYPLRNRIESQERINTCIQTLLSRSKKQKLIVLSTNEAAIENIEPTLFKNFIDKIDAQVLYTVNGDNVATQTTERNLGHILFGGNHEAIETWNHLNENDILMKMTS